jgi:hypothetical protein
VSNYDHNTLKEKEPYALDLFATTRKFIPKATYIQGIMPPLGGHIFWSKNMKNLL